jgi:hypothetical protein
MGDRGIEDVAFGQQAAQHGATWFLEEKANGAHTQYF